MGAKHRSLSAAGHQLAEGVAAAQDGLGKAEGAVFLGSRAVENGVFAAERQGGLSLPGGGKGDTGEGTERRRHRVGHGSRGLRGVCVGKSITSGVVRSLGHHQHPVAGSGRAVRVPRASRLGWSGWSGPAKA